MKSALALVLARIEAQEIIEEQLSRGGFTRDNLSLGKAALEAYFSETLMMPYGHFSNAFDRRQYDVEALARQFKTSFEQCAKRLTSLRKPGQERIPFSLVKIDKAGKIVATVNPGVFRLPRQDGTCALWNIHDVIHSPGNVLTQWLELDSQLQLLSIASAITSGGGAFGAPRYTHAIALLCDSKYARKTVYGADRFQDHELTPVGLCCRQCQRYACAVRA
ncbi:short-chain fatty acyl-CoA regulator family protein [Rhizobium helianthi]|uniref:Short-chain fatty acyl-CoA regulator family protein n=1 Tax=Rhizobium helianthi TaxID=1132695 RepID=A0ABW4M909_9HYPH